MVKLILKSNLRDKFCLLNVAFVLSACELFQFRSHVRGSIIVSAGKECNMMITFVSGSFKMH